MKKFLFLVTGIIFSLTIIAQGKSGENGKDKPKNGKSITQKNNERVAKEKKDEHNKKVWDGIYGKGKGPKPSKNQPAMVRAAFQRDYPNARNVSWSKYRGDWSATFENRSSFMSSALYHANGERRDTRTPVTKNEVPRNVLDSIFKRRSDTRLENIIKIERPNTINDIFRIKDIIQGKPMYFYYNREGQLVKYDY